MEVFKWGIPLAFVALFAYGFWKVGLQRFLESLTIWMLVTGAGGGGGGGGSVRASAYDTNGLYCGADYDAASASGDRLVCRTYGGVCSKADR